MMSPTSSLCVDLQNYSAPRLNMHLFHNHVRQYSDKIIRVRVLLQLGHISNPSVNESTFLLYNAIKPNSLFKKEIKL